MVWLGVSAIAACIFGMICSGLHFAGKRQGLMSLLLFVAAIWHVVSISAFGAPGFLFLLLAAISVPSWLVFEAYNLRLVNWTYVGLPENWLARWFGYGWSFATITPAILMTAELIESFGWFARPAKALKLSRNAETSLLASGLLCLTVPVLLPREIGAYLFALVWIGFALLLDPECKRAEYQCSEEDAVDGYLALPLSQEGYQYATGIFRS